MSDKIDVDVEIDPTRPCFDCGGLDGHHTKNCDLISEGEIADLPNIEGTQYWTESPVGKYLTARGVKNVKAHYMQPLDVVRNQHTLLPGAGAFYDTTH